MRHTHISYNKPPRTTDENEACQSRQDPSAHSIGSSNLVREHARELAARFAAGSGIAFRRRAGSQGQRDHAWVDQVGADDG